MENLVKSTSKNKRNIIVSTVLQNATLLCASGTLMQTLLFLGTYALIVFARTIVDYGVPSMLVYIVPVRIAGPYNAFRMMLHTAGATVGTALASVLPTPVLIGLVVCAQVFSAVSYGLAGKRYRIPLEEHFVDKGQGGAQ